MAYDIKTLLINWSVLSVLEVLYLAFMWLLKFSVHWVSVKGAFKTKNIQRGVKSQCKLKKRTHFQEYTVEGYEIPQCAQCGVRRANIDLSEVIVLCWFWHCTYSRGTQSLSVPLVDRKGGAPYIFMAALTFYHALLFFRPHTYHSSQLRYFVL